MGFGGVGVGCLVVTLVVVLGGRLVGLGCLLVVFGGLVMCWSWACVTSFL